MEAKQKAQEIVDKFKPHVYCYMGSDFLTGIESPSVILMQAKECAKISVKEILIALETTTGHCELKQLDYETIISDFEYWEKVLTEIDKLVLPLEGEEKE